MKNWWVMILCLGCWSCQSDTDEIKTIGSTGTEPIITLINEGMASWSIEEVTGDGVSFQNLVDNPTLTLQVGVRYTFINRGGAFHPLDFRDAEGNVLLSQDFNLGSFERDPEVNFVFDINEDLAAFTLTEELAAVLRTYNCSTHATMEGRILID